MAWLTTKCRARGIFCSGIPLWRRALISPRSMAGTTTAPTLQQLFKLEQGRRYSFKMEGVTLADPKLQLMEAIDTSKLLLRASAAKQG